MRQSCLYGLKGSSLRQIHTADLFAVKCYFSVDFAGMPVVELVPEKKSFNTGLRCACFDYMSVMAECKLVELTRNQRDCQYVRVTHCNLS